MAVTHPRPGHTLRWLIPILAIYALLAGLYALKTPAWQAPDEPAHYNYVRYLVEHRQLPELQPGDYPADYLEAIKAARFPAEMSVEAIRYESHQPPLYYLLAAPVYALGRALGLATPLLPLRLFSVFLGLASIAAGYAAVRAAFPGRPWLAWATAAFMATLPMHTAMTGVVNNDVLAELLLSLTVWQLVLADRRGWTGRRAAVLGLLVGLAFLTKLQAYVAAGLVALGWALDAWRARAAGSGLGAPIRRGLLMAALALALVLPWLARNVAVYGLGDPLGMVRHDQVVVGQLTTRELLGEMGAVAFLRRFAQTTFQSFWGQFGWMGVPLPPRVYQALALLSGLAALGLLDALPALRNAWRDGATRHGLLLMGAWLAFTGAGFLWYNLKYVQHQGRYLFPAIVPLGLLFAAGVARLLQRRPWWALIAVAVAMAGLLAWGLAAGDLKLFAMALLGGALCALLVGHGLERRVAGLPLAALYGAMAGLALWALRYMAPLLRP